MTVAAAVLDEADRAGLLDDATEHVSFRVPRALLEAAKRETGLASMTELGLLALAALARPDPVSAAMKRTRGKLGPRHTLEYWPLGIDLDALLRRWKPDKRTAQLRPRPASALVAASAVAGSGRLPLVPDTTVYIHSAAGTLPPDVEELLDGVLQWHVAVALGEITTGIANLDPAAAASRRIRAVYKEVLAAVPSSRVLTPDAEVWLAAGMVSGTLARTQGFQRHQRKEVLNDALIYLTAAKAGLPVLTANRGEFDLIQQLAGSGTFIYYEHVGLT